MESGAGEDMRVQAGDQEQEAMAPLVCPVASVSPQAATCMSYLLSLSLDPLSPPPGPSLGPCLSVWQSLLFRCSCQGTPVSHSPSLASWLCE